MTSEADVPADTGGSSHYFDAAPSVSSAPRIIELVLPDVFLQLHTDAGVFAGQQVDSGTRYLLQEHPAIPAGVRTILDLGCGYGPIALTAGRRAPDAEVWAVDVNSRARSLTEQNAAHNDVANLRVASPEDVPDDMRFDLILSNPPIRIGKAALHDLLSHWLDRLSPGGRAWLVVQKHLGSDSLATWMNHRGNTTTRLGSRKGYRLLEVEPRRAHAGGTADAESGSEPT